MTELDTLVSMRLSGMTWREIADQTGMNHEAVRSRVRRVLDNQPPPPRLSASPYPRYDQPLKMEGDALCLFDTEFPFHHAEFLNRVFDLAQAWNIRQCVIGGDVLHFETFSRWGASWIGGMKETGTVNEDRLKALREKIQALPPELQAAMMEDLNGLTEPVEGDELSQAKKGLDVLTQLFDQIDFVIGNHDERFIRLLNTPLKPQKLLDFLGVTSPRWRIAPYYFSELHSGGELFRIEHPRSAAQNAAVRLADKYECSVIVGHSHLQEQRWSTSGRHWAIHAGCGCDEARMPYAAQRSSSRPAHHVGAVIVRGGYPVLLCDKTPWDLLVK